MTTYGSSSSPKASRLPSSWVCALLGLGLIVAGLFILGDVALATVVSTLFIGSTSIAV